MKKILVAYDFSSYAKSALKYACSFASAVDAELTVLTVYNTLSYSPNAVLGDINKNLIAESLKLTNQLEKEVSVECKKKNVPFKVHASVGIPEIEIQKYARKIRASLIIMGHTGNGGMKRFLLGSTTSHVMNTSPIPVLIVPANYKFKSYKQMIFTTDLNPKNVGYMKGAVEFAKFFNAQLTVLYIDTEDGFEAELKIGQMQEVVMKKYGYEKIRGIIMSDYNVKTGFNSYLEKYKSDLAILVKYHPGLKGYFNKQNNSGAFADTFNIPVLVMESKRN